MTRKPTLLQGWALLLVLRTAKHLGRAPEPHEVCAHHRLPPKEATRLRVAVRGLIRKDLIRPWPILRTKPLRLTASALSLCTGSLEGAALLLPPTSERADYAGCSALSLPAETGRGRP